MSRPTASNFSEALRLCRKAKGLTQEDFDDVSSRVYVSALERGAKQPTLPKVDALALKLGLHPLTLLALSYAKSLDKEDLQKLFQIVQRDYDTLALLKTSTDRES